jgi:integrating conjugative element protein (TIGR03761 family)
MTNNQATKKPTEINLQTEIEIIFHSEYAINLIEGTPKKDNEKSFFIIGLIGFSSKLKLIKRDLDKKNPYARFYFDESIKKYETAKKLINQVNTECDHKIKEASDNGLGILEATSLKPEKRKFNFSVSLCYKIALLLKEYDHCIRKLQPLKEMDFISGRELNRKVNSMSKSLRQLFHSAELYNSTPLTINDLQIGNDKAIKAESLMGRLPGHEQAN